MEMAATLKIYDNRGNERIRQVANATKKFGETTKTIIQFLSPADVKGTTMLLYEYDSKPSDMWIYMPALRNARRIISTEKAGSFMGSEFSNADMARPLLDDFNYRITGNENFRGKECYKIESVSKNKEVADENGYYKKVSYIETGTFFTLKVEYYDEQDRLFKVMELDDYRKQADGKYFAFKMEITNILTGRRSTLTVDKFQTGSQLTESSFATTSLGS